MSELALFDDFFTYPGSMLMPRHGRGGTGNKGGNQLALPSMHMDFAEEPNQFVLHADLPGYKKDDISISVENGVLSLEASKEETKTDEKTNYFHRERSWGKVHRAFKLPSNASHDNAAVAYTDGVLRIAFPKVEKPGAKKLTIQ